jgi:predicted dehydrogenase
MTVSSPPLRVAILGCGQIADAHLSQLRRIPSAQVVAVCDVHEDLAWQAAIRFQIPQWFTNLERMIAQVRPDVVHLTTPAQTHAPLAVQLLEQGCHLYVEKPFALDAAEAKTMLDAAQSAGRQVCVGHDQLFDPCWLECRRWVKAERLGKVLHVESVLGYPLDGKFGAQVVGNPHHWVQRLPGGLFQNTISHPLYRITDFMEADQPRIQGGWRTRDGFTFPTELNLSFDFNSQSASLTFSTLIPAQRITRIYGSRGTLEIDFDAQSLTWRPRPSLPGAFAKLEAPCRHLGNAFWNLRRNVRRFCRSEIHYFGGMKTLFEAFYASIREAGEPPVPYAELLRVTLLMDRIFAHCRQSTPDGFRDFDSSAVSRLAEELQPCQ